MLSRLTQGVTSVLQELSGEEHHDDGDPQDGLVPQPLPGGEDSFVGSGPTEETLERLAQTEQLVVQLKEMIREKDQQLENTQKQLKEEKEQGEAKFMKLKLQAKAKVAALTKQISELKGQDELNTSQTLESSFTAPAGLQEELQELKQKLNEEEKLSRSLREQLRSAEDHLREKEEVHAEQVRVLQAVVQDKDVRFQEQIQKHEEELLQFTTQTSNYTELQQVLRESQRRMEELEEALRSRSEVVEMLQEELNSADQQKQILTAQFRQMEQELAESCRLKEQELQTSTVHAEERLQSLRASLESEREQAVVDLQAELIRIRSELEEKEAFEAELTGLRANLEASERQRDEATKKLEAELQHLQEKLDAVQKERDEETKKLETDLQHLQEKMDAVQKERDEETKPDAGHEEPETVLQAKRVLEKLWIGLHSVSAGGQGTEVPDDPAEVLTALEARLENLRTEHQEREDHMVQVTAAVEDLQAKLDKSTAEGQEAIARVQQLQQQLAELQLTDESLGDHGTVRDVDGADKDAHGHISESSLQQEKVLALEQQVAEQEREISSLREQLEQQHNLNAPDSPEVQEDLEDTTLIAVETSAMSTSVLSNESSPELTGAPSESPVELKPVSSDEMVTSTDSEVAHSSWTLLEAVNQEAGPEWPQDFGALHVSTQSWEETGDESVTSTCSMVEVESSSVVIRETVQVQIAQHEASLVSSDSGQAFAQILAEELQKRYSELLSELENLRSSSSEAQERVRLLEEDLSSMTALKNEAETKAQNLEARTKIGQDAHSQTSETDQESDPDKILEEQLKSLQVEVRSKDQKIQALQKDLDEVQNNLSDKEGHARMIGAQLEDKELALSSMEAQIQEADAVKAALLDKTAESEDLQQRLSLKEQEMMELSESMTAKLLQAGEEKFSMSNDVKKLKEQILEMEKENEKRDTSTEENEELVTLRKENENLAAQVAFMKSDGEQVKRKLQAALVKRKELMKKLAILEKDGGKQENVESVTERDQELQKLEEQLQETLQALNSKEEALSNLEHKTLSQDQALAEANAEISRLIREGKAASEVEEDNARLKTQVATMESELDAIQKKLQEAVDSRKDTLRKAKEKDRHHREQLRQQKEEYSGLLERFEAEDDRNSKLLQRLQELEQLLEAKEPTGKDGAESVEKESKPNDWVQEDWVDFSRSETETKQPPENNEALINSLEEKVMAEQAARVDLERCLEESQASLLLKESELIEVSKDLEALRSKERQIDALSEELDALREKCQQAEAQAEMLKAEMEEAAAAARANICEAESPIAALQAEVAEFKQFLENKNGEINELYQQLSEQGVLLQKMQETVLDKDQTISSLQDRLKAEEEKVKKMEAEEETKDNAGKLQQLQRKLQAALVSRKETLKENQGLKEEQAAAEKARSELLAKIEAADAELSTLRSEKQKLIEEVDRTLLENQSLGASCESLKLAMDGLISEKDACQVQAETARLEAEQACGRWEEKVQSMKDEYETLLKSYENVSDEAERVRKVLEAVRQERQESSAKARAHEAAKQEAERLAEEAQKEVDAVKEKMRKFAKAKHNKITELEEENEKLREQVERKEVDREMRRELEKVKRELDALRGDFETVESERSSLEREVKQARELLDQERDEKQREIMDVNSSEVFVKEKSVALQSTPVLTENQEDQPKVSMEKHERDVNEMEERIREQAKALEAAEGNLKELQAILSDEQRTRLDQESKMNTELASLKQQLQESAERETALKEECSKHAKVEEAKGSKVDQESVLSAELASLKNKLQQFMEREKMLEEECSEKETQLRELRTSLELEKDDLEERLMNQLAQVNGSIAGYQQEAADCRERLVDLQGELEKMEKEQADLEEMLASERDRASRLEEDRRQAQRLKAEAEAEAGKQRELEQKLKSAQRVKEGSQNRARQLEELLREKQMEVRQMQKDCIQYQERISELDRQAKVLSLGKDEVSGELKASLQEIRNLTEDKTKLESELATIREKLNVAQSEAKQSLAEKKAFEGLMQKKEAELKSEAERTLDEIRYRLGAELKQMELRLDQAYKEREREEEATLQARAAAEAAEKNAQKMQTRLDESLARLAAFSRSMSSLQDDRDRVLDEAKQWETRFHTALQNKEAELREAESRAREASEQLQRETTQKEEMQDSLERLQKAEEQWKTEKAEAEKKYTDSLTALEQERGELQQKLAQAESSLTQAQSTLGSLEAEAEGLRRRAKALEEAVNKLQDEANQARMEIKERETEERRLCLNLEQVETDLRSSKSLTDSLQAELAEKEKREVELLGEKEHAVTQAVEEARKDAESRMEEALKELAERKANVESLEERLRKAEDDARQSKARLDSFTKAMGSLQDDRDLVLNQYKQLEERHLELMMEKDGLIQEAATENNGLKEEIRALLSQRDDLHAENAKLDAQLHGYRDELQEVLTMKESQHKKLLSVQLERIGALEREREDLQANIEALEKQALLRNRPAVEHESLSQAGQDRDAPSAEVEKLREQLQAAKMQIGTLEEKLTSERETYTAHTKELKELRWEGGLLRTETETAEERVAELARDLMEMEQKLLAEKEEAAQLRAQNQSFGQAMASLQDSHDEAVNEVKKLRLQMEESRQAGHSAAPSSGGTGEVWSLKNALSALQNDRERMLEQLRVQRSELDRLGSGELSRLTQALDEERQKSGEMENRMTTLLQDRDVSLEELEALRLERRDWQAQAEALKQQTLATLSEREQQIRQLSAMLEKERAPEPKLMQEHRQGRMAEDSAPGGPLGHSEVYKEECVHLQRRLDEEMELRLSVQDRLSAAQDQLKRYTQDEWQSGSRDSEAAVLIEPLEGAVTRSRSSGPGLVRMLRGAFCSRQRTPLLVSVYLLTVHVLLLLCVGGYL